MTFELDLGFQTYPEIHEPALCKVSGQIPKWLKGVLFRSGPGQFVLKDEATGKQRQFAHWFDGLQLIHRFEVDGYSATVKYSRRGNAAKVGETFLNDPQSMIFWGKQPEDPCVTLYGKFFQAFKRVLKISKLPPNINVVPYAQMPGVTQSGDNKLVITTDANMYDVMDKDTLISQSVKSYAKVHPQLNGQFSASHACSDPVTGEYFNFSLSAGAVNKLTAFSVEKSGKFRLFETVSNVSLSYVHSFALTQSYLVILFQPYIVKNPLTMLYSQNLSDEFQWLPEEGVKYYVFDRSTSKLVKTYRSDPYFVFHTINAFDLDGDVVIDLCGYQSSAVNDDFTVENLSRKADMSRTVAEFYRITLPNVASGSSGAVAEASFKIYPLEHHFELPRINDAFYQRQPQYVYAVGGQKINVEQLFNCIIKIDIQKLIAGGDNVIAVYRPEGRGVPAEPIFISNPEGDSEDDGVILSVILDHEKAESYLIILDAKSMTEVARAWLGTVMNYNFHGVFDPKSSNA
ncbi:hypothetical protein MP228_007421 [Amoeboaphelidium protococcarum]|nr:hypothetical protein MP228_007421 [Amoeboaphelidium protococcarum]